MDSPATNFDRHERGVAELITRAYRQCKRFVEHLGSASEVKIYNLINGQHIKVGELRKRDYRAILPIGLTIEAFTPFSAISKELNEIQPILGEHAFFSISVDDLFVLKRFLPTTGELCHYLEVRQRAAGIPNAMLFDEIDHLGAYIKRNRFDMAIEEQLRNADMVTWDGFCDPIDEYFEGDTWQSVPAPCQEYPREVAVVLDALGRLRPTGWLEVDSHLRDLDDDSRHNLAEVIIALKATLPRHFVRRLLFGDKKPIQIWLCLNGSEPSPQEMRRRGQIGCIAVDAPRVVVLRMSYRNDGKIVGLVCESFSRPPVTQLDYADLRKEAEHEYARRVQLPRKGAVS